MRRNLFMPEELTLEQFLQLRHPQALKAYERYSTYKWEDLEVGTLLMMLKDGFNGSAGCFRKVIQLHSENGVDYAILANEIGEGRSILTRSPVPNDWRQEFWTDVAYLLTEQDLLVRMGGVEGYRTVNERRWYFRDLVGIPDLTYGAA